MFDCLENQRFDVTQFAQNVHVIDMSRYKRSSSDTEYHDDDKFVKYSTTHHAVDHAKFIVTVGNVHNKVTVPHDETFLSSIVAVPLKIFDPLVFDN